MRTGGRLEQDTPATDGNIIVCPEDVMIGGGTIAITRNGAADYSLNAGAGQTCLLGISLSKILQRTGMIDDSQSLSQFASTTQSIYGPSGRPPFTGQSQLTPQSTFRKKGFKLTDVTLVYLVTGAALTQNNIRIDKVVYANNVANAVTSILADGANGLATATQANPYVTKVVVGANADFNVSDNSDLIIEVAPTTQGGGAYRLYRAILHGSFNFN